MPRARVAAGDRKFKAGTTPTKTCDQALAALTPEQKRHFVASDVKSEFGQHQCRCTICPGICFVLAYPPLLRKHVKKAEKHKKALGNVAKAKADRMKVRFCLLHEFIYIFHLLFFLLSSRT